MAEAAIGRPSMIAGHFAFAAAAKSKAPSTPLWALMLACQWLDVVFVPLLVGGIERMEAVPGTTAQGYGHAIIYADYTHSLLGALVLAALFGGALSIRYGKRNGVVLGVVAFSHWLLDLPMHRADMPLLPGNALGLPRLGFGLWQFPLASAALEAVLVIIGAALYWRAARRVSTGDASAFRRANLCGLLVLLAGAATLALNVLGL